MAAATQVLNTNELLEHIIGYLPAVDKWKAMRVARRWHEVIKTAPSVRGLLVIMPFEFTQPGRRIPPYSSDFKWKWVRYSWEYEVRISGLLAPSPEIKTGSYQRLVSSLPAVELAARQHDLDEHATIPPVYSMYMNVRVGDAEGRKVVAEDGVRVRHLVEAMKEILRDKPHAISLHDWNHSIADFGLMLYDPSSMPRVRGRDSYLENDRHGGSILRSSPTLCARKSASV